LVALGEVSAELYETAERWWRGLGPPAERVSRAIEGVVTAYDERAGLLRIAAEVAAYDEEVRGVWMGVANRFIEATAEHIRPEQDMGLVRDTLDARSMAESLFWMAERSCYVYLGRHDRTGAEVIDALAPVWTAALYPGVIPAGQLSPRHEP